MANEFARFAKLPEPHFEKIELQSFAQQAIKLFNEELPYIHFEQTTQPIWIAADKDMLQQVFHNLLLNAQQATEQINNPKISVSLTRLEASQEVVIQITDNGVGISAEQQERIFTPYFTTKSSGSGIGLSVVRQIIEKHNGSIRFESVLNQGTTFYIRLKLLSERT
jgi:signal transduction histidine kinase